MWLLFFEDNSMAIAKFSKPWIDSLPPPASTQELYWDSELPNFGLLVSVKTKAFVVRGRLPNGKQRRITIGRYPVITLNQARKLAIEALADFNSGIDPVEEREASKAKAETLQMLYDEYKSAKSLTPKTLKDYDQGMANIGWNTKPWQTITGDMVIARFNELSKKGKAQANRDFRTLRAILAFGAQKMVAKGSASKPNPCEALKGRWHPVKARTNTIKLHQLGEWHKAVRQLKSQTTQDYLLFTLLTGFRRNESATLKWETVDFKDRTITIPDPKNHKPHILPMSAFVYDLLKRRKEEKPNNSYVFSSDYSESGHFEEPKRAYSLIGERTGIFATIHDLRRTFGTVAAPLVTHAELKSLMNHKAKTDVTLAHYTHLSGEALRDPMERITNILLKAMELIEDSNVILFKKPA